MSDPGLTRSQWAESAKPEATAAYQASVAGEALVRVLDQYLADLEAGRAPARDKLLAEHPELALQLERCLSGIEFIHRAASPSLETPAELGDFRVVREVGRGGMGVVYEAEQLSLKRKVALKVLRFGAVADQEAMERFKREAETVAQLHHTNIVPIFAIGSQQGVSYFAMQFIEGRSLAVVLTESQKASASLNPTEVAQWGFQAADALAHAHQRGVIHRDVKPSNLILDPDGRIWLTDFGLAKRLDDAGLSMTGTLLGTPRYMSPEQASATRLPVDQRTDIYSLGATLYELVTGKPMFDAQSPAGVLTQILTTEPAPPRRLRAGLPRDLETIILKCVSKEPASRYDSAQALASDLRAFAEGWPIKARRASLTERTVRWVRRQRRSVAVAATAAAIAVLLVVGGIASWWSYRQSRQGYVSLTTDGASFSAEILPENSDDPVASLMAVPSQEPVALPEGRYRLRLSASGLLSETWPLEVQRGSRSSLDVRLHRQWLWPPMNVLNEYRPAEPIDLAGRTDLVLVQSVGRSATGAAVTSVRRLDGATGKPVWPEDFEFDEKTVPAGTNVEEWLLAIADSSMYGSPSLLQPSVDLDGDGTRDLIWACRNSPSLVAISGKDGKLLWWFRGRGAQKDNPHLSDPRPQFSLVGGTIGQMVAADDGGGTPDLIACFQSWNDKSAPDTGAWTAWIEAVSGRTGKSLWQHALSSDQTARLMSRLSESHKHECRPEVARIKGRQVVVVVMGGMLMGVDVKTGKEVWPPLDLRLDLLRAPQIADLDGDGRQEVLLVGRQNQNVLLTAVSLETGATNWTHPFEPFAVVSVADRVARDWPVVGDLDGDGRAEAVIPILKDDGRQRWAGVEVLDAATGEVRWRRRLQLSGTYFQPTPIQRMVAGPDLDGDGCREVFVAFSGQDQGGRSSLTVVALSGADGQTFWRWSRAVPRVSLTDKAGPIQWWHAGVDGWPQLVVPIENGPGAQPMTFILSAATGRLAHTLSEVAAPRLADFNGDGIADIFYHQASSTGSESYGKVVILRGTMPEPWRRLGRWTPAQDFDGDGTVDLMGDDGTVRSGDNGRVLWRTVVRSPVGNPFLSPPLPQGDLDGDGTPDVLGFEQVQRRVAPNTLTFGLAVSTFSGKDGRKLWTADFGMSSGGFSGSGPDGEHRYPCLDWFDLDQDGRAEVLVAYPVSGSSDLLLAGLSGRDGKLLWKAPLVAGGFPLNARHRPQLADLNGDGTLDLVLCAPNDADTSRRTSTLLAVSGQDGRALWPSSAIVQKSEYGPMRAAAGDLDGDGTPEVVLIQTDQDARGRHFGRLLALDGRDGRTKWTWSWDKEVHVTLPPLLVNLDDDSHRAVCACIQEQGVRQIVVLGPDGHVRERIPLKTSSARSLDLRNSAPWWAPADLDGDGSDEILFVSDNQLWASRGSAASTLWKWPLPTEDLAVSEIRPNNKDRLATVVVQAGRSVCGLSGLTGRPLWRCETEPGPVSVLWAGDSADPPRIATEATSRVWSTGCRQAWPIGPDGRYSRLTPVPFSYAAQPPEEVRPLPWWGDQTGLLAVPAIGGLCLVLVVAPGLLASQAARRDQWLLGILAVLCGTLGIMLSSHISDSEVMQGVSVLVALAVPGQFGYWALRRKSLQLHLLVLTGVAAVLGAFLYEYRPSQFAPGPLVRLGHACTVALLMGAATLPMVTLAGLLIAYVRRRQWARIGWLLGLSVFLSIVLATVMLALDLGDKEPSEQYTWNGWYMVWPIGAYTAGVAAFTGLVCRSLWRQVRAWFGERSRKRPVLLLVALLLLSLVVVVSLIIVLSPFAIMHVEPM